MRVLAGLTPSPFLKRLWNGEIFSSLTIMGMRVGMLAAKFILSLFMARFMGLEELGIYGLIVGASGTVQAVMRGGIFTLLSRDAVHQSLPELTHHLRHYGIGIFIVYGLLVPVAFIIGWYFDMPSIALLALAVFLTEHLCFDAFVLVNNLQYPKLANFIYSLQSASWIYLFVVLAFFYPELRSIIALLTFWIGGGLIALGFAAWLSRSWPWEKAFASKLEGVWYPEKIKSSLQLYLTDVLGVANYYMDRYIVTLFLSLELTGIYVFFAQIVTATWNLVNSGVLMVYRPRLIQVYDSEDLSSFNDVFSTALKRTLLTTFALSFIAGATVPFIVKLIGSEVLLEYLPLFWIMLAVLLMRVSATAAGTALFAMHKDRDNFFLTLTGFVLTAIVGSLGVFLFGVYGIVLNTIVVSIVSVLYARTVWGRKSHA